MRPTNTPHTSCRAYQKEFPRLLALPESDQDSLRWREHSATCDDCRELILADSKLAEALTTLPDPGPAYVRIRVMRAIHASKHPRGFLRRRDFAWGTASAAFGVLLGLVIAAYNLNPVIDTDAATTTEYALADTDPFDQIAIELTQSGDSR